MNISDLKRLKWISISDWTLLLETDFDKKGDCFVSKSDILNFITNYVKKVANKTNIQYELLYELIKQENEAFYSLLDDTYETYTGWKKDSNTLINLLNYFRVPDILEDSSDPVNDLLIRFEQLSDIQKLDVLSRLKILTISVEHIDITTQIANGVLL